MKTKLQRALTALALAGGVAVPSMAFAQHGAPEGPPSEKINQVIVYGNDPCPKGQGDEIVVCKRMEDKERYRIPKDLRGNPNNPANEAWGARAKSIEYVGRSGIESCSPVGAGGATGCFNQIVQQARAERQQAKGDWADLVAAERAKRLSTIDADSEKIEAQAKTEEAAKKKADAAATTEPKDGTQVETKPQGNQ